MKGIMWIRKSVPLTLLALFLSVALTSAGTASPILTITQANPVTMVYLDPPTINGTAIGVNTTVTVEIMIRDADNVFAWQVGLTFNPDLLNCTGFFVGEFLSDWAGPEGTFNVTGVINNTAGMVRPPYASSILGSYWADGDGRLAYATFRVKATGVSDIHLSNVKILEFALPDLKLVPVNIIDVYTVVLDKKPHTVVTVSNSTDTEFPPYANGLYDHSFNPDLDEIGFKVKGPHPGFSNVTIPKDLLPAPEPPRVWAVVANGTALSIEEIIKSENGTHTSIYFTYPPGINDVQITTRFMPSTISIALSEDSIRLGEIVTISGNVTGADDEVRADVTVTIYNRTKGDIEWDKVTTVITDQNGEYTYEWEPGETGTYEVMASWEGDLETLRDDSPVLTLRVKGAPGIPLWVVIVIVVAIVIVAAVVVYFVKFRKRG